MTFLKDPTAGYLIPLLSVQLAVVSIPTTTIDPSIEQVPFPEGGASKDLGLAIPYLPDMDDVVVDEAQLTIRAIPHPVTVESPGLGSEAGATIVDLQAPARLVGLDITLAHPLAEANTPEGVARVVVSAAESGAPQAPIFACPILDKPDLYPRPLAGMSLSALEGDARLTFDQPVAGSRWALQVAAGKTAGDLKPVSGHPITVNGVDVDAAPTGLTVVIPGDETTPEAILYANPGILLPDAEPHQIVFTPLAQRHLQQRLAAAREQHEEGLLGVPLRLTSMSAGAVGIVSRTLRARYTVSIEVPPPGLTTGGEWAVLPMAVPAGRRPTDGRGTFVATLAGRELDPAFGPPPRAIPANGITVVTRRHVAASGAMTAAAGTSATLTAARILAAADRPAEVVLELRSDNAGLPGPIITSVVRTISTPSPAWQEFLVPAPVSLGSPARVWCVLRTNDEPVRWFCTDDGEAPLLSVDDGASWGEVATPLGRGGAPMLQLFRPNPPDAVPVLECRHGSTIVAEVELVSRDGRAPEGVLALPAGVLEALGSTSGTGRVTTELLLYSRTVMQLQVRGMACAYDPFAT